MVKNEVPCRVYIHKALASHQAYIHRRFSRILPHLLCCLLRLSAAWREASIRRFLRTSVLPQTGVRRNACLSHRLSHRFNCFASDLYKVSFKTGPTYQSAIDVRMSNEFADVARGDAATVKNTQGSSCLLPIHLAIEATNEMDHFASALDRSRSTSANSPDWFISDNDLVCMLRREVREAALDLSMNYLVGLIGFILCKVFADADNRAQAMFESCKRLFINHFIA